MRVVFRGDREEGAASFSKIAEVREKRLRDHFGRHPVFDKPSLAFVAAPNVSPSLRYCRYIYRGNDVFWPLSKDIVQQIASVSGDENLCGRDWQRDDPTCECKLYGPIGR